MHNQVVLILSALEEVERQVFRKYLSDEEIEYHPASRTDYYTGFLSTETGQVQVILARTDQTNVSASLETDRAINHFKPHYAFFVGVAGGLKDVGIGDLVIGKDVFGYERGKTTSEGFKARPGGGSSSYSLERFATNFTHSDAWKSVLETLTNQNFQKPVRVVTGTIASGEKVDADVNSELHKFLHFHCNHALAVEMEGYGFLEACRQHPSVQSLLLRGISDLIDGKSITEELGSQPYASANAAAFTISLIRQLYSKRVVNRLPTNDEAKRVITVACQLYPGGIQDASIWERAGGRVSDISLNRNGRSQWQDAIRIMRNGGGGASFVSLLTEMQEDYPENSDLGLLRG